MVANGGCHFEINIESESYKTQFIHQKHAYSYTNDKCDLCLLVSCLFHLSRCMTNQQNDVHPAKTQIRLGIPQFDQSLYCVLSGKLSAQGCRQTLIRHAGPTMAQRTNLRLANVVCQHWANGVANQNTLLAQCYHVTW